MKNIFTSLTMKGPLVQIFASFLIASGVTAGVSEQELGKLLEQVLVGAGALAHVIGYIVTYIGRKRANENITVIGVKR